MLKCRQMQTPSSSFKLSCPERRQRSNSIASNLSNDDDICDIRHHSYVPSMLLQPKPAPSVSTLINLSQRYHFKCGSSDLEGMGISTPQEISTAEFSSPDLGVTLLQALIMQMKTSKPSQMQGQGHGSCTDSGQSVSGLNGYCNYLTNGRRGEYYEIVTAGQGKLK